jgi:NAD(P)-dependent dehydrogenase (short-subunit alcohol dehydrogenase family)
MLHSRGAAVVGADRTHPRDSTVLEQFIEFHADQEQSGIDLVRSVTREHTKIDVLVHAVGILGETADPFQTTTAEWDLIMRTNASSAFTMVREAAAVMKARGGGAIVLFSSVAAKEARRDYLAYNASKIAVLHLTWSMAQLLAPYNINVNAVCPGPVNTEMWSTKANAAGSAADAASMRAVRTSQIPCGRFAEPEEVARVVGFLVDPDNRYLTGLSLDIAGGAHLGMGT